MSLVAYDASDNEGTSSETECNEAETTHLSTCGDQVICQKMIHDHQPRIASSKDQNIVNSSASLKLPDPLGSVSKPSNHESDTLTTVTGSSLISSLKGLPKTHTISSTYTEDELEDIVKPRASELALQQQPVKRKHQPVKIMLPSIDDYDSDDEQDIKKPKKSETKCGLFAMLPQPKHMVYKEADRPLIPASVTRSRKNDDLKKSANAVQSNVSQPVRQSCNVQSKRDVEREVESSDDEEDGGSNFFSLKSSDKPVSVSVPYSESSLNSKSLSVSNATVAKTTGPLQTDIGATEYNVLTDNTASAITDNYYTDQQYYYNTYQENDDIQNNTEDLLNNDEFLKIQGKRQRGKETINIIDVSADEQTSGSQIELTKNLTEELTLTSHSKKKNKDMPTSQQKRKHQITFLAFKAKERELDLKNQWAENRSTRKQTQSKYGF